MEMNTYPGKRSGRLSSTGMQGTTMSLLAFSKELDSKGQSNPAYEQDFCSSINTLSHSANAESLDKDDSNTEVKASDDSSTEVKVIDDSNTEVKKVASAHSETKNSTNQEMPVASGTKSWDVFRVTSEDNISCCSNECWNTCFRISRLMFCSLLFLLVLMTSIISKMTFLLMTSNIFPSTTENNLKTSNGTLSYTTNSTDVKWVWGILLTITAPYLFTILKYLWVLMLQRTWPMQWNTLIVALILESLHSVGLCIFVLIVLPSFDPLTACAVSFCICPIPGILKIVFPLRNPRTCIRVLNILAVVGQIASICVLAYYISFSETKNSLIPMVIFSPFLISISWWENFVLQSSTNMVTESIVSRIFRLKKNMSREKVRIGIITNLWKIILTLIVMPALLFGTSCKDGDACMKTFFFESSGKAEISIVYTNLTFETPEKDSCYSYLPFVVSIINVMSSVICYKCVKVTSKILAQKLAYAIPLVFSTPIVFGLFLAIYSESITLKIQTDAQTCVIPVPVWTSKNHTLSSFPKNHTLSSFPMEYMEFSWFAVLAWLLGFFSFLMISNHIWSPDEERLIATERIFVRALYSGVFLEQSLFLNRRRILKETNTNETRATRELPMPNDNDEQDIEWLRLREDDTPMIYMCATMWHESEVEMVQILKSIFRQDYDQCTRKNFQLGFGIKDPDYYEFEAHIFFDDAFDFGQDTKRTSVNEYVKRLVKSVEIASRSVTGEANRTIDPPIRTNTPYGGRLEWRLPGENKLIAHLKDKTKIRHRKRWSQVMYMYYFLAHKLTKKRKIAENTFILALDGDVDFQPNAVQLLVDRMKKNPNVGAACGRIHPIGSGPMVWYQQFEYAVSHWLQKAAEHIMGCVLCSPGCFSLFRGSALMDDNVMAKYTTLPSEARHHVQYDQGEDRWLCTLMLQQGYKIEYVAASDALTYAPETFHEFYNQRRRWSPSTMANIIDLLMDWKNVTRKNEDITKYYIMYQMFLMICSILTPGTIFLMILGAISIAFPAIPPSAGMVLNLIPVVGMIVLCFVAKQSTQLTYAAVVSILYSLLMMLVIVGIILEAVTAGLCSVTTLFLLFVVGVFFVSAVIHPQEFYCVLHGFLYFLSIPSMSMLLMIYSLGNLHVVSWGTRDTEGTAPKQQETNTTNPVRSPGFLESFGFGGDGKTADYLFSCGRFIRCCPLTPFRFFLERLDVLEAQNMKKSQESEPNEKKLEENVETNGSDTRGNHLCKEGRKSEHEQLNFQSWMDDEDLEIGTVGVLDNEEATFWKEFIQQYLKPLELEEKDEKKMKKGLIELRNRVCLAFLSMNALFVTAVYVLTEVNAHTEHTLSIKLPCTVSEGPPGRGYIEPISFAFTGIFGIMLFLQFICMLMHRMSTFLHIVASVDLDLKTKRNTAKKQVPSDIGVEDGLEIVKVLQNVMEDDAVSVAAVNTTYSDDSYKCTENKSKEMWKKYTKRLREQTQQQPQPRELRVQFVEQLNKLTNALDEGDAISTENNDMFAIQKFKNAISTIVNQSTEVLKAGLFCCVFMPIV